MGHRPRGCVPPRHVCSVCVHSPPGSTGLRQGATQPGITAWARQSLTKAQSGAERASQGLFPRGHQAPPLVDPFPHKVWHQVAEAVDRSVFVPGKRLHNTLFPKGSTTLAVKQQDGAWWAQIGIPVTPEEFLDLSSRSIHPERPTANFARVSCACRSQVLLTDSCRPQ